MKRLLFWAQMVALAVPLLWMSVSYIAGPKIEQSADSVTTGLVVVDGNPLDSMSKGEALAVFNNFQERILALEKTERRKSFADDLIDRRAAPIILYFSLAAWVLQILAFGFDMKANADGKGHS